MIFGQSSTHAVTLSSQERTQLKSDYQHWRAVGMGLNNLLVKRLAKTELHAGAKKLGLLSGGTLVFDSVDECAILFDYCIHHVRTEGRNAVERELVLRSDAPESDELTCLQALQHSIYSLFIVEAVERGVGVHVRDLRYNAELFLVDFGIGSSAVPGLILATRIISVAGLHMTGGAAIPLGQLPDEEVDSQFWQTMTTYLQSLSDDFDPAMFIRESLRAGMGSQIQFHDVGETSIGQPPVERLTQSEKVGRNAPCPCGSGKKFKHCCQH